MSKKKRYAVRRRIHWLPLLFIVGFIVVNLILITVLFVLRTPKNHEETVESLSFSQVSQSEIEVSDFSLSAPPDSQLVSELEPVRSPAQELLTNMTLREKVYQMFIVYPSTITGISRVVQVGEATRQDLERYPVGGLVCDRTNLVDQTQIRTMLQDVQKYSKIPLILTCDEEGGRVNRLMGTIGTTWVGPMLDYKDQGIEQAVKNAETIAEDLFSCGFNTDLAPVADVWSNPKNTVIGDRAYSDDFQEAAQLVAAAVRGFHSGGVACTLKHFPGHGNTSADSHYGSVFIKKTLQELIQEELLPFQAGIDAGADMVMIGHLIVKEVDPEPALFSHQIVTELLREEMGFDGVVITDGLEMKAITDHYTSAELAVKAVRAGVDILLEPENLEQAADALIAAVESNEIPEERIDQSVLRILTLKQKYGLLPEE